MRRRPAFRVVGLLAVVLLAGRTQGASAQDWGTPNLPRLSRAAVTGDTVWLQAAWRSDSAITYFLVRPRNVWHRVVRATAALDSQFGPDGVVTLGGGARYAPPKRSASDSVLPAQLHLPEGRVVELRPVASDSERAELSGGLNGTAETSLVEFATNVSAAATSPRAWWLGLNGGFPEGMGELGALLRVDRTTGQVALLPHEWLSRATVTAIVPVGDTLFVGTFIPFEYGPSGGAGLIAYEPARDRWRNEPPRPNGLLDAVITTVAQVGDSLLVATEEGVALRPTRGGPWTRWRMVPRIDSATITWELGPAASKISDIALATTILWQAGVVTRPADFARRFARLPLERRTMKSVYARGPVQVLADTLFLPELLAVLGSRNDTRRLDAFAVLASLHHPMAEAAVRAALADDDPALSARAAVTLGARNDSAARELVSARLRGSSEEQLWALPVVREARNVYWLGQVAGPVFSDDSTIRRAQYAALAAYPDFPRFKTSSKLLAYAERDPDARRELFRQPAESLLARAAAWSSEDSARARRVVVLALADKSEPLGAAVRFADRFRVGPAIPRLIDALVRAASGRWNDVPLLAEALESLTGVTGPSTETMSPQVASRAAAFWTQWRAAAGARIVSAVPVGSPRAAPRAAVPDRAPPRVDPETTARDEGDWLRAERERNLKVGRLARRIRERAAPSGMSALRP